MDTHFLNSKAVTALRETLDGELLLSISRDIEERRRFVDAREIFKSDVNAQPIIIIRCESTEDVIKSIQFTNNESLSFSIRAGGHHFFGACIRDKGVVIDVSQMKEFSFDKEHKTATLQPGCDWHSLEVQTYANYEKIGINNERYGLVATGGDCPTVLNSGYTLGGGYSLTSRCFGLACDNLISADVVLADGKIVQANEEENPDLHWALKGAGGGNFGVVTSLKYQLHLLPKEVLCGYIEWPISQAEDVMKFYRDMYLDESTPDELALYIFLGRSPYPEGEPSIGLIGLYVGAPEEGETHMAKIRAFGNPTVDSFGVNSYLDFMTVVGAEVPYGLQAKRHGGYFNNDGLSDEAIRLIVSHFKKCPSSYSLTRFDLLGGGAIARVPEDGTAFLHRESLFHISQIPR